MINTTNKHRGIYDHVYKGSEIIDITSYFEEYKNIIKNSNFHKHYEPVYKDNIVDIINNDIDKEKYDFLAEYCNIENLTVDGELGKMTKVSFEWCKDPLDPSIIDNVQLQTVSNTKRRNLLKNYQVHLKYRSEKPVIYERILHENQGSNLIPESDILLSIRIYVPFTSRHKQSTGALGKLSFNCVIVMYGSQTLDKLRDQITCISDYSISTEMSNKPIRFKTINAKSVYKSGFFFIEDTFYIDLRDHKNKDNSKVIREWAEARKIGFYKTAKMEETRIDSLALRFGFPWVYQHQGDCEHLISFSDARLVNPTDELSTDCYPRIIRIKPRPNRYCMTCGIYSVDWVIMNNNRLPHNPCLFCDSCFKSYNYIRGKKIGSFKAYPYPFDSDLLQLQLGIPTGEKSNSSNTSRYEFQSETAHSLKLIKTEVIQMETS